MAMNEFAAELRKIGLPVRNDELLYRGPLVINDATGRPLLQFDTLIESPKVTLLNEHKHLLSAEKVGAVIYKKANFNKLKKIGLIDPSLFEGKKVLFTASGNCVPDSVVDTLKEADFLILRPEGGRFAIA
mmetsp:Transcript_6503/g.10110  ORF Transcript_6503/g.10110 Transcript_6503/m.10110 type:complete len:130 (-) Transcript_6503:275-664(-)